MTTVNSEVDLANQVLDSMATRSEMVSFWVAQHHGFLRHTMEENAIVLSDKCYEDMIRDFHESLLYKQPEDQDQLWPG